MAASCVGRNVRQTAEKRRPRSVEDICAGPETNSNGSGNLLAGVCALISYEYSLFGAQSCQWLWEKNGDR